MSIKYEDRIAEYEKFGITTSRAVNTHSDDAITITQFISYEQFVTNLVKARGTVQADADHMVIGIAGEVGEVADCVKKFTIYGKPLDRKNLVEELGDIEFYLAGLRQLFGVSRTETLRSNIEKLKIRYADGYSDRAAITRADKMEQTEQMPTPPMEDNPMGISLPNSGATA